MPDKHSETFTVRGQEVRYFRTTYKSVQDAVEDLGEEQTLKLINYASMLHQRQRAMHKARPARGEVMGRARDFKGRHGV